MLKNFFKIAFRNLWRSKGFSTINILGLAVGMASAVLILLWIQNEVGYDQFHQKKDRIYEAWNRASFDGKLMCWNTTPKVLARTLEKDIPEVEQCTRAQGSNNFLFSIGDKRITASGRIVDSNFLQVFSFPLLKGNASSVLSEPHTIAITQRLAIRLFGKNEEPIGKIIKIDNKDNFKVTGLLQDPPTNTRFDFDYLIPWSYLREQGNDDNYWGNNSTRNYVLLKPNASAASVNVKLKTLKPRYEPDEPKWEMFIYPISRWRLYSDFVNGVETGGGRITFVKLFGVIAIFILLIACINFMNLGTARSEKRAKEVGIRKVVGAQKSSLIVQFIGESILLAFIAGLVAILLVQLSLSGFNTLTGKKLFVPYGSIYFWIAGLLFVFFTGLLAGSYPAFFLSAFKPVTVLKGTFKKANALVTPRKVLVVLQFTFAITLIICTVVVKRQIEHARDRDSGYDRVNLIYHMLTGDVEKNYTLIRNELLGSGVATSITKTSAPLTESWSDGWGQEWQGKDPNDKTDFSRFNEDGGLGKTAGLQFIIGRDIDVQQYPSDSLAIILNQSALNIMKFKNPIGQIIKDNDKNWHVVGVIKDFILSSPYEPVHPMLIYGPQSWFFTMQIRLNPKNTTEKNLEGARRIFKKYNPEYPFEYKFVDDSYAAKFEDEKRTGTLAGLFAGLTIFISCLGLFGLATYMAETRIKEIGVRKVLGASVTSITTLLAKDFIKLVIISFLIASPIAWYSMHEWLQHYSYRTDISWWIFAASGFMAILIAVLTISFQSVKAAIANPVKSLRMD